MKRTSKIVTMLATCGFALPALAQEPPAAVEPAPEATPAVTEAAPEATPDATPAVTAAAPESADWGAGADTASTSGSDPSSFQLHGFVSQGFMVSSKYNYLTTSKKGSFELFEAGLNVTKELDDNLRVGVQIFAQDLGDIGNYKPVIDWAYLDYRPRPQFGLRAGRFKLPLGIYNENMDVDVARTPVMLPQGVYDQELRDVLQAIAGIEAYGVLELGGAGAIDYAAYAGAIFITPSGDSNYHVDNVVGSRVIWSTPLPGLRLSGSILYANFNERFPLDQDTVDQLEMAGAVPPGFDGIAQIDYNDWIMAGGAAEYSVGELIFTAEYFRWMSDLTFAPAISESRQYDQERAYAMAQYRPNDWFASSLYYSLHFGDTDDRSNPDDYQKDLALTFRFDVTPSWLVKVEGHFQQGTLAVDGSMNPGNDQSEENWAVGFVKTTLAF
jgi:hypothetical protein